MGERTAISWCDHTFNPWIGCTKVSPACDGCYAEAMMDKRYGRVQWGAPGRGNGTRERTSAGNWSKPKAWDRKAEAAGSRPFVFCSSLADVFDNQVPTAWRTDLFELIRSTPNLVWLLLTKRPQNIVRQYGAAFDMPWPKNAAIGTTVEDQTRANTNIPHLLDAKVELNPAFAFLSCEPLLGPINLRSMDITGDEEILPLGAGWLDRLEPGEPEGPRIDWVITGGETDQGGHLARPSSPQWFLDLRDQCASAGVAFHHKQNGEWVDHFAALRLGVAEAQSCWLGTAHAGLTMRKVGKHRSGRLLDGVEHNARPEVA